MNLFTNFQFPQMLSHQMENTVKVWYFESMSIDVCDLILSASLHLPFCINCRSSSIQLSHTRISEPQKCLSHFSILFSTSESNIYLYIFINIHLGITAHDELNLWYLLIFYPCILICILVLCTEWIPSLNTSLWGDAQTSIQSFCQSQSKKTNYTPWLLLQTGHYTTQSHNHTLNQEYHSQKETPAANQFRGS